MYLKAYNHKIIPVFLTVLSTVLGLVPFFIDSETDDFWFSFAVGTTGGLLFSIVALVFVMPIFMPLIKRNRPRRKG
jgi:multidrug efflux pump subunit AcrB